MVLHFCSWKEVARDLAMELKREAFEVQEVISRYHVLLLGTFYHLSSPILFVALVTSHVILTEGLPYYLPHLGDEVHTFRLTKRWQRFVWIPGDHDSNAYDNDKDW